MYSVLRHKGVSLSITRILDKSNGSQLLLTKSPAVISILTNSDVCKTIRPAGMGGAGGSKGTGKVGSKHQITYKPYVPPCYRDHDHKNMSLKRPMSPHLTIYAPTFPAFTSILQRISGSILTFYALMLSCGTLFLSNGVETYVSMIQSMDLSRPTIFLLKVMLGLPFCFHYFLGIRYALWNSGRFLKMKEVYDTGKKACIAGGVITILFALL